MKKVLMLLIFAATVLGARMAMADAYTNSMQGDNRLLNGTDLIFMGYANKVLEQKGKVDFRLQSNTTGLLAGATAGISEWGGVIDDEHKDFGVIGVYVNRPLAGFTNIFAAGGANNLNPSWTATGNSTVWNTTRTALALVVGLPRAYTVLTPANKVDIFYGKDSDNSDWALHLNYADNTSGTGILNGNLDNTTTAAAPVVTESKSQDSSRVFGGDFGFGIKNGGSFGEIDLHAGFSLGMFSSTEVDTGSGAVAVNNDSLSDNGIYTISAGVLARNDLDKDSTMRLFADFTLDSFGTKASITTDGNNSGSSTDSATDTNYQNTTSQNDWNLVLGAGCNHKVNDGAAQFNTGLVGNYFSLVNKATEQTQNAGAAAPTVSNLAIDEKDTTVYNIVWNGSVDAKVTPWLNVRGGISKNVLSRLSVKSINNPVAPATVTTTSTVSATTAALDPTAGVGYSMGFGINWQNFVLNANVSAASFETAVQTVEPAGGVLFPNSNNGGGIVNLVEADLTYNY
ncbi:MAG TPA: hypothetical protein VIJ93_10595 [bacterium]